MSSRHPEAFTGSQAPVPGIRAIQESLGETSRYPLNVEAYEDLGDEDIPFSRYTSKEFFAREMDKVWTKTWQWACREENLREVGDFVVYDPLTNLAWENVSVRVVEADQEWSGCTCVSPYLDWYATDSFGRVLLDEYVLADAAVGFVEDGFGAAVLGSAYDEDEALVVLEIDALGFAPLIVEVPVSWAEPDVFIEVPFF